MQLLIDNGVLASEMETSALFIQTQLYRHRLRQLGEGPAYKVYGGAVLGIGAIPPDLFMTSAEEQRLTEDIINLSIEAIKILAISELITR